jgi:phage terminase Nu1 subunit (DNA packaging protein)
MSKQTYPASVIAKLFDLTERRVRQLADESIIPKPKEGKYDLTGSITGYIKYLKRLAAKKQPVDTEEQEVRMRILRAQAATAELDLKKETGEFISIQKAIDDWQNMILAFRSRMLAMPYRAACSVIGVTELHEIEKVVKSLVYEALDELAEYNPNKQ